MNLRTNTYGTIKIRPITMEDFSYILKWSKDKTFCTANDWEINRSEEELYDWWVYCINDAPRDFVRLGIELEHTLIGYVDFAYINKNSAELGIAIGDSTLWGKGIGFKSSISAMDFASKHLGITIFSAETHETNNRARRMLERIGFNEISRIGNEKYLGRNCKLIQYQLSL